MKSVALVTYQGCRDLSDDDQQLLSPLRDRYILGVPVLWDDPTVDWQRFAGIVLRSTWDYPTRRTEFQGWLERIEAMGLPFWNDPALVRWNLDKRYLLDLATRGFKIPTTVSIARGDIAQLRATLDEWKWETAVLKPTISNAGLDIARIDSVQSDLSKPAIELVHKTDVLLQEFVPEILSEGEWSLIYFGGAFSHAVLKQPGADDFRVHSQWGGATKAASPPPGALLEAQRLVLAVYPTPLYARVDGVLRGESFVLMELELIEPSLFLLYDSHAAGRFADAIASRVGTPSG